MATVFRNGLPPRLAASFEQVTLGKIVQTRVEDLLTQPYSTALAVEMRRVIASGSTVIAVKRGGDAGTFVRAVEHGHLLGHQFAASPVTEGPQPVTGFATRWGRRVDYLMALPMRQRVSAIRAALRRRLLG